MILSDIHRLAVELAGGDQPGTGAEVDFLYLVVFLAVATLGPGRYSLDAATGRQGPEPAGAAA